MKKFIAVLIVMVVFTGMCFAKSTNTCNRYYPDTAYAKRYGNKITYYDKNGEKIGSHRFGANGSVTSYDKNGRKTGTCKRDARIRTPYKRSSKIINTYDRFGNKTGAYKRYGNTTTYYDKNGKKLGSYKVSINGSVTRYDEYGNKIDN